MAPQLFHEPSSATAADLGQDSLNGQTGKQSSHQSVARATVRFCGDSGDGMQLVGSQFARVAGAAGNDLVTFPDFPAEIRAPQGTLAGVSGFQICFASMSVYTPGDEVDLLVAMNPAALKTNLHDLRPGGALIVNIDSFDKNNLARANYSENPLQNGGPSGRLQDRFTVIPVAITSLTRRALEDSGLSRKDMDRCKNFFALGIACWLFDRDLDTISAWVAAKFKGRQHLMEANQKVLRAGNIFAENSELFTVQYEVSSAHPPPGTYRNIFGSSALVLGLLCASEKAGLPLFYGSYPITPASEILHELSRYRNFGVKTFQAEDEIAAVCACIGAAYGGSVGVTASSGPGIMLKSEAINLAVIAELPLVVIDAQRAGPSTGLPTKTEQADLLMTLFGRNSESPIPLLAAATPSDSFNMAIEAVRIALRFMTPVFLLSDLYLILGSEPWHIPDADDIPQISCRRADASADLEQFSVYRRDPETLARLWPFPGQKGFEHRIGGLEKHHLNGNVSYDPENHEQMVLTRSRKVENISRFIPDQEVFGDSAGELLVVGWGSTYGAIRAAVEQARQEGHSVSHAHLRYLNPFPPNLKELLQSYRHILVAELNMGQLAFLIQGRLNIAVERFNKIKGQPFLIRELKDRIYEYSSH